LCIWTIQADVLGEGLLGKFNILVRTD